METFLERRDKIKRLEEELAKEKALQKAAEAMTDEQKLAEVLHGQLCRSNHVDACGWTYESWQNPGYARKQYLDKATNVLAHFSLDAAFTFLGALRGLL